MHSSTADRNLLVLSCLFPWPADNWVVGWGQMLLGCCFPWTLEALMYLTRDTTTHVWGADLFKPEWLAAVTQATSPRCKACDSHLTLLSRRRAHCLWTGRGGCSLSALWLPHPPCSELFIFTAVPHGRSYLCTCGGCKELLYYLFSFNDLYHSP